MVPLQLNTILMRRPDPNSATGFFGSTVRLGEIRGSSTRSCLLIIMMIIGNIVTTVTVLTIMTIINSIRHCSSIAINPQPQICRR